MIYAEYMMVLESHFVQQWLIHKHTPEKIFYDGKGRYVIVSFTDKTFTCLKEMPPHPKNSAFGDLTTAEMGSYDPSAMPDITEKIGLITPKECEEIKEFFNRIIKK